MSNPIKLGKFELRSASSPPDLKNNADAFEIRVLLRPGEVSAALNLRHRAYASQGHIPLVADGEYRDAHDDNPSTAILGGYDQGRLVATMRLCFAFARDDLSSLPCAKYYPALADVAANAPRGIVEVSRLALEPEISNTSYRATFYGFMVRSAFAAAHAAGVSSIAVATKAEWVTTYKRLLRFEQIGEPAFYPPGDLKITLLVGSLDDASKRAWMRNRFFHLKDEDVARMRLMLAPVLKPTIKVIASAAT